MSNFELVKELRQRTNAPVGACSSALKDANGDIHAAMDLLRIRGILKAEALSTKEAKEGKILSYIHAEKIGVLLEVSSQTDFVARSPDFIKFCDEVAMQIAASSPLYVSPSDVNSSTQEQHRKIFRAQLKEQGKPEKSWEKIVEGKLGAWLKEVCLTEQESVIHPKKTIEDLQNELIVKCGERIHIKRFVRWELGEGLECNSQVALA